MGSNAKTRLVAMKTIMNTIQQLQLGDPVSAWRNLGALTRQFPEALVTEAFGENAGVVGGSESGKDGAVNAGYLPGEDTRASGCPAGVRAVIVAQASQSHTT